MSAVMTPPPDAPSLAASPRSRRRKVSNVLASMLITLTFVIAVVPLVFLVIYVVQKGSKVMSWSFLTDDLPFVDRLPGGGMGPAVVGTLLITGAASLMAIPLGVLGASPGASTAAFIATEVLQACFADKLTEGGWLPALRRVIPTWGIDLKADADATRKTRAETAQVLKLENV